MELIRMFALLYIIVIAGIYYLYFKSGRSGPLLPGDYYRVKAGRIIYIPFLSALVISIALTIILRLLLN